MSLKNRSKRSYLRKLDLQCAATRVDIAAVEALLDSTRRLRILKLGQSYDALPTRNVNAVHLRHRLAYRRDYILCSENDAKSKAATRFCILLKIIKFKDTFN